MEFGVGWGRTRHILKEKLVNGKPNGKIGVCGASIDPMAPSEEIGKKPLCRLCAKARHINPCRHCGGTGMEPGTGSDE